MKRTVRTIALSFPVMLLLTVYVGDFHRDPFETTPVFFAILLLWALSIGLLWRRPGTESNNGSIETGDSPDAGFWARGAVAWWIRGAAVIAAGLLWVLLSDRTYQGMRLYPRLDTGIYVALGLCAALLALLLARPPRPIIALGVLVAAGLAVRACGLWQWEINPARRDMLALVMSALDTFLSGENPYGLHQMQVGSEVPLTYPPGLWLAHLPPHFLGLDIRWAGWLADGIVVLAIGGICIRNKMRSIGPLFLALAAYIFLPDIHWNGIYAEPNVDWAVIALLCAAVMWGRPLPAGGLMGLALAMRPFNLILLPFLAIWLIRHHGIRVAFRAMLVAGLVAAAFFTPFVLADPDSFYAGTVRWLLDYGPAHNKWFWGMLGCSGQMYKHHLADWLIPMQLGGVAILLGLAAWKLKTTRGLMAFWAVVYAVFVAFNSIIWMSFWIGVCVIAMAGTAATDEKWSEPARRGRTVAKSRRWLVFEVGAAVVVAASAWLILAALEKHFSEDGIGETKKYVADEIEAGDLVIDRSGYRVAFMKAPFIFRSGELPAGVVLASDPFSGVLPRRDAIFPMGYETIWVVERYGLFGDFWDLYSGAEGNGGPYEIGHEKNFGRYKVLRLDRKARGDRVVLSDKPDRLIVSARTAKKTIRGEWSGDRWLFGGRSGWRKVGAQKERFRRIPRKLIWAHPWKDAVLEIGTPLNGSWRWITLYGGLKDRAPKWGKAPVKMVVKADGGVLGEKIFPNAPGLSGRSFVLRADATQVTFEISASDNARRHFLFDAVFSK